MGNSGLHIACLAGKLDIVKLLLEHGAEVNALAQVCPENVQFLLSLKRNEECGLSESEKRLRDKFKILKK